MNAKKLLLLCIFFSFTNFQAKEKDEKKLELRPYDDVVFEWTKTLGDVLELAKNKHYRIDNPEKAMVKSINAFLTTLDPHSSFLDPDTYRRILETTSGEFFGIGVVIDTSRKPKDRFLTIIDVIPDGPSEKIGLLPFDKIIEIDGDPLEGMTTEEATSKLRGEKDTVVHVKVMRENKQEPIPFDITRGVVKEQTSLSFYLKDFDTYYLSLTSFTSNAMQQIANLLQKSTKNRYKGLILDLRNNSGGLLRAAIDIAGLFLPRGSLVVSTRNKKNEETERYITTKEPVANNGLPIFILTNNFTASAGEILAGALKMHSEAEAKKAKNKKQKQLMVFLIGSPTFGKGSVQEIVPIGHNCAAKLTTHLYHLPDGTTIQGTGIKPDFMVEKLFDAPEQIEWFKKFYGREKALTDYIKPIGMDDKNKTAKNENKKDKKDKKPKNWAQRARESLAKDNQFLAALTLLNLLDFAIKKSPDLVSNRNKAVEYLNPIFTTHGELNMDEVKG